VKALTTAILALYLIVNLVQEFVCFVGISWHISTCTAPWTVFSCPLLGREIASSRATSTQASRL